MGAVKAFLAALKSKDMDALNEATALRAQREATSQKNRDLFKKIFDMSLTDTEIDELASKLDGFKVAFENPARSTGSLGVVVQKSGQNGAYTRHLITVRHEKKGWGVSDIGPATEFKSMGAMIKRNTPKSR